MMATETSNPGKEVAKQAREENSEAASGGDDASKKQKDGGGPGGESAEKEEVVRWWSLSRPMTSVELFQHFNVLIRHAQLNCPFSEEWARGMLDLVKKGHPDPEKMIGCGVESFQVRWHEMCSCGRTFFLVRKDGSTAEFCFRTCVNNILPLPEAVKVHHGGVVAVCLCHLGSLSAVQAARRAPVVGGGIHVHGPKEEEETGGAAPVTLGPMTFQTSPHMFQYFCRLLFRSPLNEAINEDDHLMLLELLKNGDPESEEKIGSGFESFQVRIHPAYTSLLRSFYLVRGDGSMVDFCYIKCVDNIFPLSGKFSGTTGPCSCHYEDGHGGVTLGYRKFRTSTEMVLYFKQFFRDFPLNTPIRSERTRVLLLDLLKKGDPEWGEKKMGSDSGEVQSFQIREHPNTWNGRSFFIVWENGSMEPFCVMTCIDNILPLPKQHAGLSANSRGGGGRGRRGGGKGGAGKRKRRRGGSDCDRL